MVNVRWSYEREKFVYDLYCEYCQEKFEAARRHAQYCSVKCRVKAGRQRKKEEKT